jgi:Na+-transporting NADH:ubiquinone oxidoreductase subunit B
MKGFKIPEKKILIQKPMLWVCYALIPLVLASVLFFGWRSFVLTLVIFIFGILTEALFTFSRGKPVTSAAFVTCLIFSLSLPPTVPFWMAIIGICVGVALGKMVFGGFGQNIFNPAMVGRCFLYVTFPVYMTYKWVSPLWDGVWGFTYWTAPADAVTKATPLIELRQGASLPWRELFFGDVPGSLGETSALLILIGGLFILYKKAASWRLVLSSLSGGLVLCVILRILGFDNIPAPLPTLFAGSFLFGCFFVVTEPISGTKTRPGQWIYGFLIGGLVVVLRGFSNFSEGVMFSVLFMNAFSPLIDQTVRQVQNRKKNKS